MCQLIYILQSIQKVLDLVPFYDIQKANGSDANLFRPGPDSPSRRNLNITFFYCDKTNQLGFMLLFLIVFTLCGCQWLPLYQQGITLSARDEFPHIAPAVVSEERI
jgi:hypothetical protein